MRVVETMGTSMKITLIYAPVIFGCGGGGEASVNQIRRGLQRFQCKNDNRTQAFSAKRSMVHIDTWAGMRWDGRLSHRSRRHSSLSAKGSRGIGGDIGSEV